MSTGREAHLESCAFALAEIEALTNRIHAAREKAGEALAAVVAATGEQSATESGRMAYEWTAKASEELDAVIDICSNVTGQLLQYQGGW